MWSCRRSGPLPLLRDPLGESSDLFTGVSGHPGTPASSFRDRTRACAQERRSGVENRSSKRRGAFRTGVEHLAWHSYCGPGQLSGRGAGAGRGRLPIWSGRRRADADAWVAWAVSRRRRRGGATPRPGVAGERTGLPQCGLGTGRLAAASVSGGAGHGRRCGTAGRACGSRRRGASSGSRVALWIELPWKSVAPQRGCEVGGSDRLRRQSTHERPSLGGPPSL